MWEAAGFVLMLLADLVAVLLRHDDVAQHDVRADLGQLLEGEPAVAHGDDVEVLVREGELDDLLDRDAVVREQDLLAHPLLAPRLRQPRTPLPARPASRAAGAIRLKIDRSLPPVNELAGLGSARSGAGGRALLDDPDDVLGRGPGQEHVGDAELLQLRDVLRRG